MPSPVEFMDDLTPTVTTGKLEYTVRKPPYLAGSVLVFRNGMLQDPDFWIETDPETGEVTICEEIFIREEEDHAIHIAYETFQPVFVNPTAPVHISRVRAGDVLRIAMKAGRHLEPVPMAHGQTQLRTRTKIIREGVKKVSGRAAKSFSRTTVLGFVTMNNASTGVLNLQVESRNRVRREHLAATIKYRDIQVIQKYVTPAKEHVGNTQVSSSPRAAVHPGAFGLGSLDAPGFMNLVRVFW